MGVHTFPKGICPEVNVIARLEYELAYYDSAVHRFNHYTTRTVDLFGFKNSYAIIIIFKYINLIFKSSSIAKSVPIKSCIMG